jgi:hypothetical protein
MNALGVQASASYSHELDRMRAIERATKPGSLTALLSSRDDLYRAVRDPFDPRGRTRLVRFALTEPTVVTRARWRELFAARTLRHWGADAEVWVSKRLFADRPKPEWNWVEGEDRNLRWRDMPALLPPVRNRRRSRRRRRFPAPARHTSEPRDHGALGEAFGCAVIFYVLACSSTPRSISSS